MTAQKTMKLSERIAKAFCDFYFIRIKRKNGVIDVTPLPALLDSFETSQKNNPGAVWLPSSRLMGTVDDLKTLINSENRKKYELSSELCSVIEYELSHSFNAASIKSDQERESWGFAVTTTDDGKRTFALTKLKRESYKNLYTNELQKVDEIKKQRREDKEKNALSMETVRAIVHELHTNPGICFDVKLSNATTVKDNRVGMEQTRPVTRNLLDRIKLVQKNDNFLNITDMHGEDGNGSRIVTRKPKGAIEFPADLPELKNVFWVPKEKDPKRSGVIAFLTKFNKMMGRPCDHGTVTRAIERAEDSVPKKIEVHKEEARPLGRVVEKTAMSVEPQSPREVHADLDGPEF